MLKIQIMDMLLPWLLKDRREAPDHRFDRRHWL